MARFLLLLSLAAGLALGPSAHAQIGGVGLPALPNVGGVPDVPQIPQTDLPTDRVTAQAGGVLRGARLAQIESLLRGHRDVLEADPQGEPIVRSEILALAPSAQALAAAEAQGFRVVRTEPLDGVGSMVTLRAPQGMATAAALQAIQSADPEGVYDYDHLHLQSGAATATITSAELASAASRPASGPRIGLIDGGVAAHPSLDGAIAEQRPFASASVTASPHATAIASLLAGRGHGIEGAASQARVYVADIYGGQPTGGSSAALVRALAWLTSMNTPVINVSLVGPRNRIVERVVASAVQRGFLIVAAVGNDGPAAAPLYPAAYPGVVGVTAVDARNRALIEAERGPQVDFAAFGLPIAASGRGTARMRGTSFAAPVVAGLLAGDIDAPGAQQAARALQSLRARARDLGQRGRDDVYGEGLVGGQSVTAGSR